MTDRAALVPSATFVCAECGGRASEVRYLPPGVVDQDLAARSGTPPGMEVFADRPRLAIHGGPITVQHHLSPTADGVERAVRNGDSAALHALDPEYAPFWCPRCQAAYCERHWDVEVVYDDGFYDCHYGTCPRGHRRMLMD